MGDIPAKV